MTTVALKTLGRRRGQNGLSRADKARNADEKPAADISNVRSDLFEYKKINA